MSLTLLILILTLVTSIFAFSNPVWMSKLMFRPYAIVYHKEWYRFFTYGFVHADFIHLLVNLWVLYIFGEVVEASLIMLKGSHGVLYFILLYVGGLLFSPLLSLRKHKEDMHYAAVGSSGAISAIVFAFILMYPLAPLMIFPIPISIPAFIFGMAYIAYSWYMSRRSSDHIGHDAHLLGAIFGLIYMIIIEPSLFFRFLNLFM
jgi:membrane associated rhomboid family serine protease